jgi:hypothetical protein
MAAGDMSFRRIGITSCSCAKIITQASLRPWVGARLANSGYLTKILYFLNYSLTISARNMPSNAAGYWPEGNQTWAFKVEPETYSEFEFVNSGSFTNVQAFRFRTSPFYWGDPILVAPLVGDDIGSYVFEGSSVGALDGISSFSLQSFTPGDEYSITIISNVGTGFSGGFTVTRTFSEWFSPEMMFEILSDDLELKRADTRDVLRPPVNVGGNNPGGQVAGNQINGAFTDRAARTVYVNFTRAIFYEAEDVDYLADAFLGSNNGDDKNFGHAARKTNSIITQGLSGFNTSEGILLPGYLMRSDILIAGRHHIETQDSFGRFALGDPRTLECANVIASCPETYEVNPPEIEGQVKSIWIDRPCGGPDRSANFPSTQPNP